MATGATAGAAAAAIAEAIKASGTLVRLAPNEFQNILARTADPLVVHAWGGFLSKRHQYLTSYRGLAFFTSSVEPLSLPSSAEIIESKSISMPA